MSTKQNTLTFQLVPRLRRFIHISRMNRQLMALLADFFAEGLMHGNLCVAILTPRHQRKLSKLLKARGVDVQAAVRQERFFALNVKDMFSMIGFSDEVDEVKYYKAIERISNRAASKKQPIRAFGEIIGLRLRWPRFRLGSYALQDE